MELTNQQKEAVDQCLPSLLEGNDFALVGYAGTGKTTVSTELIKMLPPDWQITYCAYTNKAAQVIERMLAYKGLSAQCDVSTIHSLLKLTKETINHQTGKRTFKKSNSIWDSEPVDYTKQLLVVDEMGCVPNSEEAPLAYELFQLPQRKLFMGDPCQLPPVGEDYGCLFQLLEDDTAYLTDVVRYDGAILEAATRIRNAIKEYDAIASIDNDNDGTEGIFKLPSRLIKRKIAEHVKHDEYGSNKDFCKVITWTNKAMDYWNSMIRTMLYGSVAEKERFIVGGRIVALDSCTKKESYSNAHSHGLKTVKLMSASEEGVINNVSIAYPCLESAGRQELKTYHLDVTTEYGNEVTINVIHEDDEAKLKKILLDLQKKREWKSYWTLRDWYHNINDSYSLTIQRMQGSTCRYVVLDTDNFNQCKDVWKRNRIYYTGLTRAEKAVYL